MRLVDYIVGEMVEGNEQEIERELETREKSYSYYNIDMRNGAYILFN